jgi:hypothetical protein
MSPLEARLAELARLGQTITYGALAAEFGLRIRDLAAELEHLMEADHAAGQPLRAAICEARLAGGQPAPGFFDKARALGYDGLDAPASFVDAHRTRLFSSGN